MSNESDERFFEFSRNFINKWSSEDLKNMPQLIPLLAAWDEQQKRIDELEQENNALKFQGLQATECGKCGVRKHTPWRDDVYNYVCATCFDNIKEEKIDKWKELAERMAGRMNELYRYYDLDDLYQGADALDHILSDYLKLKGEEQQSSCE
jgi:hypothetical protein